MPTISFTGSAVDYSKSNSIFDLRRSPSQVGLLTEIFRRSPGVRRSIHPTHSIAVWSADPAWWIDNHLRADSPCGRDTPFDRLFQKHGKIILAGVSIGCLTFFHYAEAILEPRMPFSPFTAERYTMGCRVNGEVIESAPMRLYEASVSKRRRLKALELELHKKSRWREKQVGTLHLTVIGAREIMQTLEELAERGIFCYD